MLQWKYQK